MIFEYSVFGKTFSVELEEISVPSIILHATPDRNIESIKANGLKVDMPKTKALADTHAIFCTIPSDTPNTQDLFRYYDTWSIVVIDTQLIPEHRWYVDFFAANTGKSKHIMTFTDIPPTAIKKIIK